jgi:hypothetical protein
MAQRSKDNGWLSAHGESPQATLYVLRRAGVEVSVHLVRKPQAAEDKEQR